MPPAHALAGPQRDRLPAGGRGARCADPALEPAAAVRLDAAGADPSGRAVRQHACYVILALAIDLIWGYCGILSLGHGAFFALGGYAMGMYLMRQIGSRGVYGNSILPDFMVCS